MGIQRSRRIERRRTESFGEAARKTWIREDVGLVRKKDHRQGRSWREELGGGGFYSKYVYLAHF